MAFAFARVVSCTHLSDGAALAACLQFSKFFFRAHVRERQFLKSSSSSQKLGAKKRKKNEEERKEEEEERTGSWKGQNQILDGPFSVVPTPIATINYSLESA